ncbi:MAG: response regulator [Clostridia bacterium]|nr:response regulator [Clostridia bacterium]
MSKAIMIVDDEQMITSTLAALIKMFLKRQVMTFNDPEEALKSEWFINNDVDLIISDFLMPGMNGIEFLKSVREKNPDAVTILLTGYADKENAIKSINEVGVYYYLEKPWDNTNLIKIIQNGLEKKELSDELKVKYFELKESNLEVERLYNLLKNDYQKEVENVKNLVVSLANVIEAKDKYTDGHTRRVGLISGLIGQKLHMSREQIHNLEIAGIIHDIGKVGVPEGILNKPGKLTDEEFEIMKRHSVIGENICKPLSCLQKCLDPVRHHHEKLNGSGYPDGLQGSEISLEARILAVVDIFDALYSKRPYRDKLPMDKVKAIIKEERDRGALDERVVDVLFELIDTESLNDIIENG